MKILIVDDSMLCRKMVGKYLLEQLPEAQFFMAANGKEGYEMYQQKAPDFMILDLLMPDTNGMILLSKVKQDNPAMRVVVLSADIQKSTKQEVEKIGALHFFAKPFTREQAAEIAALLSD